MSAPLAGGTSPANVGSGDSSPVVPVVTAPLRLLTRRPPGDSSVHKPRAVSGAAGRFVHSSRHPQLPADLWRGAAEKFLLLNSAAAVPKLKANDVILSLGGLRIEKPEDLAVAGKKYAGQQVVAKCLDGDTGEALDGRRYSGRGRWFRRRVPTSADQLNSSS